MNINIVVINKNPTQIPNSVAIISTNSIISFFSLVIEKGDATQVKEWRLIDENIRTVLHPTNIKYNK